MLEFLLCIFFSALAIYLYLSWNFDHWRRRGIVGPIPRVYFGTFPKTASLDKTSNYIQETSEIYRKYYRKHRFIGVFEYRTPKLLILDPSLVSEIYVKYFKNFGDNTMSNLVTKKLDPLFKPNPFIEKLAQWKERRTELAPAFSQHKVKAVYPAIENSCRQLVQFLEERTKNGQKIIASKDISTRVIGDMVCNILFGLDAKGFDDNSDFVEHGIRMFHSTRYDTVLSIFYSIFPILYKVMPRRFVSSEFTDWFHELFAMAVKLRTENNIHREDYLNFLLELKVSKNTTPELLHAHAFTFFLDGFETSSYMLGNALNFLAENKDCQQKLRDEINSYDSLNFDDLNHMPYLDAVLNETTRLSPFPFPIWKTCTESVELSDFDDKTFFIEKGTEIILPLNALHSHPDYYENPEKFDPERYDENSGGVKRLKDAGVFMPFGNGPRTCLGMRFAVTMIKATLFSIIGNFDISIKPSEAKVSSATGMLFFSENLIILEVNELPKK